MGLRGEDELPHHKIYDYHLARNFLLSLEPQQEGLSRYRTIHHSELQVKQV